MVQCLIVVVVFPSLIAVPGSPLSPGRCSPVALGQTPETASGVITVARGISNLAPGLNAIVSLSPATIAYFSSLLQALVSQRHEKDFAETLKRTLDISQPGTATLESLFALAAFFASNNMFRRVDDFLRWIVGHEQAGALSQFMQIPTATTRAFARVLLGSAIRIRNLRVRRRGVFNLLKKALALEAESHFLLGDAVDAANNGALAFATYVQQQPRGLSTHQMEQALEESIKDGHVTATLTLLRLGVDPSGRTLETPPLVTALSKNPGQQVLVELLLDYKADLGPLDPAFIVLNWSVLDTFIASGADMPRRIQVLHAAVCSDSLEAAAKLLRSGVDIDAPEPDTKATPLQVAAFCGYIDIVVYLLSRGATVNAGTPDEGAVTPLQAGLAGSKPFETGNLLLDHGADASAAPASGVGTTALEALFCNDDWSVDDGMMALCDRLLAAGATVNRRGGEPSAVLHGMVGHQRHALLRRFLGSPHHALTTHMYIWEDNNGHAPGIQCTPTQLAAVRGDLESLTILMDHNVDVNEAAGRQSGRTALQGAAQHRPGPPKTELITYLLSHGADVNAAPAPHRGITALQGAAISGDLILAEQLILRGAHVNAPAAEDEGRTAIQGAAEYGRLDMVQLLLNAGAAEEDGFRRAVELAEGEEHFAAADLLRRHAAEWGIMAAEVVSPVEDGLEWEWSNQEWVSGGEGGAGASQVGFPGGEHGAGVDGNGGEEEDMWPEDCWERITGVGGLVGEE